MQSRNRRYRPPRLAPVDRSAITLALRLNSRSWRSIHGSEHDQPAPIGPAVRTRPGRDTRRHSRHPGAGELRPRRLSDSPRRRPGRTRHRRGRQRLRGPVARLRASDSRPRGGSRRRGRPGTCRRRLLPGPSRAHHDRARRAARFHGAVGRAGAAAENGLRRHHGRDSHRPDLHRAVHRSALRLPRLARLVFGGRSRRAVGHHRHGDPLPVQRSRPPRPPSQKPRRRRGGHHAHARGSRL